MKPADEKQMLFLYVFRPTYLRLRFDSSLKSYIGDCDVLNEMMMMMVMIMIMMMIMMTRRRLTGHFSYIFSY